MAAVPLYHAVLLYGGLLKADGAAKIAYPPRGTIRFSKVDRRSGGPAKINSTSNRKTLIDIIWSKRALNS